MLLYKTRHLLLLPRSDKIRQLELFFIAGSGFSAALPGLLRGPGRGGGLQGAVLLAAVRSSGSSGCPAPRQHPRGCRGVLTAAAPQGRGAEQRAVPWFRGDVGHGPQPDEQEEVLEWL